MRNILLIDLMSKTVLKTLIIYALVMAAIFAVILPVYIHYVESRIPGSYNALYLSNYSPYKTIIVEIDYQPGMEPSPESIEALKQNIEMYSGKDVIIYLDQDIEKDEVPDVIYGDDLFTITSVLQENNRDYKTGLFGGNITLYILYLDTVWKSADNDNSSHKPMVSKKLRSVGVTYAADSFIIFKDFLPSSDLETTILLHELGHIWGFDHTNTSSNIMSAEFEFDINGPVFDDMIETRYPKEFNYNQREELARLHKTRYILPLF